MINFMTLLQAAGAVAAPQGGSNWSMILMLVLLFVVMWFLMIRPQRKQQKELEKFRSELQKGQKVVTAGGIYGTIKEIKERYILLEVDNNVCIRVDKSTINKTNVDVSNS